MKTLSKSFIEDEVLPIVLRRGRKHDYFLIKQLLEEASYEEEIIFCLEDYQNEDGGFGHGLEADVRLPDSNAASTNIATAVLEDVDYNEMMIQKIVDYFESTFDKDRNGWRIVPSNVDDYPHAIWWNNDKIDESFGYTNPTPEIIGFLYRHIQLVEQLDVQQLIDVMLEYLENDPKGITMHDVFSLLRLYEALQGNEKERLEEILKPLVDEVIELDTSKWSDYVCYPVDLIRDPSSPFLKGYEQSVNDNLDYLVDEFLEHKVIMPSWQWFQDEDVFNSIKDEWMGFLTYSKLKVLFLFGRIV